MSDQPTAPKSADPKCPDCGNPFNAVKHFIGRIGFFGMPTNIYQCPTCGHKIYRMGDGNPPPTEEPTHES